MDKFSLFVGFIAGAIYIALLALVMELDDYFSNKNKRRKLNVENKDSQS